MPGTVRRLQDFEWTNAPGSAAWELARPEGEAVAEVAIDEGTRLWCWYVFLPDQYQINGDPCGFVRSKEAAMLICETILLNTMLCR